MALNIGNVALNIRNVALNIGNRVALNIGNRFPIFKDTLNRVKNLERDIEE